MAIQQQPATPVARRRLGEADVAPNGRAVEPLELEFVFLGGGFPPQARSTSACGQRLDPRQPITNGFGIQGLLPGRVDLPAQIDGLLTIVRRHAKHREGEQEQRPDAHQEASMAASAMRRSSLNALPKIRVTTRRTKRRSPSKVAASPPPASAMRTNS